MAYAGLGEVILNQKVGPEHYLMRVSVPELANQAKPGQFVHVRCNSVLDPLLRRPISLHGIDCEHGTVSLLYQLVGRGTQLMAEMNAGDEIDIMGPLGNGFSIPDGVRHVLVIGGGIGVAPLFPLIHALKHYNIEQTVILGARTAAYVIGADQLSSLGLKVEVATDDGSLGRKGFVTDLAEKHIKQATPEYFFACGPNPMLKKLVAIVGNHGIAGQVSLEEHMGCGVGACLACVCKIKTAVIRRTSPDSTEVVKDFEHKKVCSDGPVFEASEVIFDG